MVGGKVIPGIRKKFCRRVPQTFTFARVRGGHLSSLDLRSGKHSLGSTGTNTLRIVKISIRSPHSLLNRSEKRLRRFSRSEQLRCRHLKDLLQLYHVVDKWRDPGLHTVIEIKTYYCKVQEKNILKGNHSERVPEESKHPWPSLPLRRSGVKD